ncbi:MAG: hypothetical protein D6713_10095 [Deltaproteobacteria bacterium]|nr:MAG: hypothetical protein D6713_10095 [Deltaproteobacteria bacterium]
MRHFFLPPGTSSLEDIPPSTAGVVVGSEYCRHLLPTLEEMEEIVRSLSGRGLSLSLLLPVLRDRDLKEVLLPLVKKGREVESFRIIAGDWGQVFLLKGLFPDLKVIPGRALSGQKLCVRVDGSPFLREKEREVLLNDISSRRKFSEFLRKEFGIEEVFVNWTGVPPRKEGHLKRVYAFPYVFVTASDYCPHHGNRPSSLVHRCPRYCRNGVVRLDHASHRFPLFQRGKGKFFVPFSGDEEDEVSKVEHVYFPEVP